MTITLLMKIDNESNTYGKKNTIFRQKLSLTFRHQIRLAITAKIKGQSQTNSFPKSKHAIVLLNI